jgi:hypothetical protein
MILPKWSGPEVLRNRNKDPAVVWSCTRNAALQCRAEVFLGGKIRARQQQQSG